MKFLGKSFMVSKNNVNLPGVEHSPRFSEVKSKFGNIVVKRYSNLPHSPMTFGCQGKLQPISVASTSEKHLSDICSLVSSHGCLDLSMLLNFDIVKRLMTYLKKKSSATCLAFPHKNLIFLSQVYAYDKLTYFQLWLEKLVFCPNLILDPTTMKFLAHGCQSSKYQTSHELY